jgi:RNA polymerase sigma factor (sigma-70 family)
MIVVGLEFDHVVNTYHLMLYRFALSLTQSEDEARDLIQQTFYRWATKGRQLRDAAKVKSWLFTTLYREFLATRRRADREGHIELSVVEHELPQITSDTVDQMDADTVLETVAGLEKAYRAPLMLFYMEDCSYKEIAEILALPIGTVMSRIARGKEQLRQRLQLSIPRVGQGESR